MTRVLAPLLSLSVVCACSVELPRTDAGMVDAGAIDAGAADADAGATDAGKTNGGPPDAGATSDAGAVDAGTRLPRVVISEFERLDFGAEGVEAWATAARAYVSANAPRVEVATFIGRGWNSVGPRDGGAARFTAAELTDELSAEIEYFDRTGYRQPFIALDLEGHVVERPSAVIVASPEYPTNLAAYTTVVQAISARFGRGADGGGRAVSQYSPGTGGTYYFDTAALTSYRSPTFPTGFPLTSGDLDKSWRWAAAGLAALGGCFGEGTLTVSEQMASFGPYGTPACANLSALGPFAREFLADWNWPGFTRADFQPVLQALDILSPTLYPVGGFPDVTWHASTRRDGGAHAGLGGEAVLFSEYARASAAWIADHPEQPRQLVPYISGELFNLSYGDRVDPAGGDAWREDHAPAVKAGDSAPTPTREVWDPLWQQQFGDQWHFVSHTHLTQGQARVPIDAYRDFIEGVVRGAAAGGHALDGVFHWEAYRYYLRNARRYLAEGCSASDPRPLCSLTRPQFRTVRRACLFERSVSLPGDAAWLAPLFGGTYDRAAVWGFVPIPEGDWTVATLDAVAPLLWKVRVQGYLEAARGPLGW
jgi:hypothetical protein